MRECSSSCPSSLPGPARAHEGENGRPLGDIRGLGFFWDSSAIGRPFNVLCFSPGSWDCIEISPTCPGIDFETDERV